MTTPATTPGDGESIADFLNSRLLAQRAAFNKRPRQRTFAERIAALDAFHDEIFARRFDLCRAVDEDFGGRCAEETLLLEIFVVLDEIRHTKRHLKGWMKPHSVTPNWQFRPSKTKFIYQPLGVIGVMGAWNYQILLTLSPVVGAISAGNHAMVRPSELAPRTAEVMRSIIDNCFDDDYVQVFTGEMEVSQAFGALPFDHLIFTGSTRVGKIIMRNMSEHLTPVTLELGGKSPALIGKDYDIASAARKILHGKLQNGGQTCVAPDYVLVRKEDEAEFIEAAKQVTADFFPKLVDNKDYTRIITTRHYERLEQITAEVAAGGGVVTTINPANEECTSENQVFPPTLVSSCPADSVAVTEEIFGPILPIVTYDELDDAMEYINERPRPLALYYFSNDKTQTDKVLYGTISGGVTVNGCIYHLPQNNLPFGGVGDSGMGAYHGIDGFETFSKKKAIFYQSRFSLTKFMRPPYGKMMNLILGFVLTNLPIPEKIPESARARRDK
jgi:coniferyl-aldehyde dehydrogenase